ncbi:3'-5' exonuclease [Microcoleus sp. AT9_A2]|uniref:UvrD-helicase domain-containing protein n=1 Tax=Microcoleus sp. AT9_A2 TaxID=2818624 RepID=UPI002FD2CBB4
MLLAAVLHPDVVDFLRTELDSNLKARVWECIEKLRQQQFDGGLRVKKLKGIAKRVWEARITQASRLIFTYNKSRQPDTGERQTYIAIQDICLDHDDVSRRAKARNQTPDAQWLDAEVVEAIGNILDERPVLTPAEQSALDAAQIEELQLVPSFTDELLGNVQWRIIDSELEWQRAIIQQDADLPLKLTPEEYELVKLYGNLLLSGSAGTGKTTVGLYRLLKSLETLPDGKRLYVAYNPILVKEAQKQFKRLVSGSSSEIESVFHFKTIRDLCLESLSQSGQFYIPEDEVTYQIFEQLYRRQSYQPYSPALVWDEIRSIIKGAHLETSYYQFSQKQYEQLGKKRSSVIPQNNRHKVYKVAEWYQGLLKKEGRFDEIDLARKVLQTIWQGKGERYQLIVCDEVQDFTELQLELLVRLVAPGGHLFFAGDLHQMISPSGFRWEDLKTKFFKGQRQAIQKTLNFNFRSVGSLVNLANQILKLRYRLLRERIGDIGQPTSSYGECARLIAAPLETLQPSLGQLNPDDAILVRTEADKQRLSEQFQSSFVFTIEEAKGLEFDTVFLVEFFKPRQSLWSRVLGSKRSLNETEQPELRLELNLLYVAVTRARRILNIWETQLSAVWSQEELVSFLQPINSESVRENRVEPTEEMWRERGCYYLECGFYRQAIECFEKSGDIELQRQTTAKLLLQEGKYSEAAQILVKLQDWQQAAQLFEKTGQWQEAANCWEKAGNSPRQKICEAKAFETTKVWEDAAQLWDNMGRFEDAKRCWLKSGNEQKKAEILAVEFEQKQQWLKAAEHYKLAQMTHKSAECRAKEFEKRKYWEQAAEQYELAGISEKAEECRNRIIPHSFNDVDANINLESDEPTAELAGIYINQNSSDTETTLNKLLLLNTEEAFKWMGKSLEYRHTIASFANDINHWDYYNGVQSRVSQAVDYKRRNNFDAAFAIYSELFQEMPTWCPLYSSVYKVLASAGRLDEAERAMQLHSLLISFDYGLRKSAIAEDNSFDLNAALAQNGKFGVLAFWPFQDPTLLLHLGAVTMLKQGRMSKVAAKGYLNSIKGQGSVAGCPPDGVLQDEGRRVIMGLPWKALANTETSGGFISQLLDKIRPLAK